VAGLADAGFGVFVPTGTYFATADIRPLGETDGVTFCRTPPERAGVVAIPDAVFYDHRDAGAPHSRTRVLRAADGDEGPRDGALPQRG
jgi:N-succinyldiaminopimelate aminotransferase